uniref:Uncharacterized protein n=1 Tax=Trichuris muris TaxID=70415 RepID=A0A5S6QBT3_TRIMR
MKNLRDKKDLLITKADKGNVVVLLNREEYVTKLNGLLDSDVYRPLRSDPTNEIRKVALHLLRSFAEETKDNILSKIGQKLHFISNSKCPELYGLPKIHKPGVPLRPVTLRIRKNGHKPLKTSNMPRPVTRNPIFNLLKKVRCTIPVNLHWMFHGSREVVYRSSDAKDGLWSSGPLTEGGSSPRTNFVDEHQKFRRNYLLIVVRVQSSAYNVHTFNRSARVEETWTTVLGLSGQMHNFRSADANALFEEHHSHMRRVYPCWCDRARIVASSLISTESNQWQLYVLISIEHSSFVAMFTFAYSGACFIKRFPAWSQQVMISATDGRVSLFAWTSGHLSKVDSADQYPELMSTFPGGVIAIDAVVINKTRITAVGCGDGHVVIFRTAHCLNQVLDRLDMKLFEVPISSMVLLPDSFGEIHMLVTSAIGAIRLYSSVPEQGSPEKFVRLQASRPLDAVLCACHVRMSSSNVACNHLIYVGTFCYNFVSPFWELPCRQEAEFHLQSKGQHCRKATPWKSIAQQTVCNGRTDESCSHANFRAKIGYDTVYAHWLIVSVDVGKHRRKELKGTSSTKSNSVALRSVPPKGAG